MNHTRRELKLEPSEQAAQNGASVSNTAAGDGLCSVLNVALGAPSEGSIVNCETPPLRLLR